MAEYFDAAYVKDLVSGKIKGDWELPNDSEKEPFARLLSDPEAASLCPRCGKPLQLVERGTSIAAECPACFLALGIRGL